MADQDIEMQEEAMSLSSTSAAAEQEVFQDVEIFGPPCVFDTLQLPTSADILRRIFLAFNLKYAAEKARKPLISFCAIVADEIVAIWKQTTIPIIESSSVRVKVRRFIEFYQKAIRNEGKPAFQEFINETHYLFDIAKCQCINICKCHKLTDKIPAAFRDFLFDQRGERLQTLLLPDQHDNDYDDYEGGGDILSAIESGDEYQPSTSTLSSPLSAENAETLQSSGSQRRCRLPDMPNYASECDRFQISYRAAAFITTAALKDLNIEDADGNPICINKNKVWREVDKNRRRLLRLQTLTDANPKAFAFDSRKDKTLGNVRTADGATHRQTVRETHVTILREPKSEFLGYAVAGETANAPAMLEILLEFFEEKQMSLVNLIGVCCDGEPKNTGKDAGILRLLEVRLQKPLHWFVCLLHFNELPFRHLFAKIDSSVSTGPKSATGAITKAIVEVNNPVHMDMTDFSKLYYYFKFVFNKKIFIPLSQVVNFRPIPGLVEEHLPADIANFVLSSDEKYLYEMAVAVSSGVCPLELANKLPGPIHHARWLTKACRILRMYVATENPSKNLIDLVTFILRVYVPMYFNVKHKNSCTNGSVHFFNLVRWSRYLPPAHFALVKKVCIDNAYFAHCENVLLAMIFDADREIRKLGYRKILQSRNEGDDEFGIAREYVAPRIMFDTCQNYCDIIDWDLPFTEPPFTLMWPYAKVERLAESGDLIKDDVTKIPCHNQGNERAVHLVTQVATGSTTKERREGAALATLESRQKRPKNESQQDYV